MTCFRLSEVSCSPLWPVSGCLRSAVLLCGLFQVVCSYFVPYFRLMLAAPVCALFEIV